MARTFVIVNPAAGSVKDVDGLVERIRRLPDVEVCITAKPGAAIQSTRRALRKGCEMVVAAGGDGTLNEVVNGLREDASAVVVGLIPLGTGNDFARTLGLPTNIDEAIALLLAGHTRAIDLVRKKTEVSIEEESDVFDFAARVAQFPLARAADRGKVARIRPHLEILIRQLRRD